MFLLKKSGINTPHVRITKLTKRADDMNMIEHDYCKFQADSVGPIMLHKQHARSTMHRRISPAINEINNVKLVSMLLPSGATCNLSVIEADSVETVSIE
jgi:hypothetical protein